MFITLHEKSVEVIIKVEAIEAVYRNEEKVYGSIVVTSHNVFYIDESVDQIKRAIMPEDKEEESYAEWEAMPFEPATNVTKYRCSKCGNESYLRFDECPICKSKMKKERIWNND